MNIDLTSNAYINFFPESSAQKKLKDFHCQVSHTFNYLPQYGKLKEIISRITIIIVAPLVYLILGVLSCLEWTLKHNFIPQKKSDISQESSILKNSEDQLKKEAFSVEKLTTNIDIALKKPNLGDKNQTLKSVTQEEPKEALDKDEVEVIEKLMLMEALKLSIESSSAENPNLELNKQSSTDLPVDLNLNESRKTTFERPNYEIMKFLKKSRLDDAQAELNRLKSQGTLTPQLELQIDQALISLCKSHQNQIKAKVILGRAIEIKNLYQDTHYILTHAQATEWFVATCLIKELVKVFFPERDIHCFKFLRPPQQTATLTLKDIQIK